MKKEKSCGAVIYKIENENLYILLLKHNAGHWSFAKGHVEEEETEEETAIREAKEETNLDILVDSNFRVVHTYSPKEGVSKDVVLFVATCKDDKFNIEEDNHEIAEIGWFEYKDALCKLTYKEDIDILKQVRDYLIDIKKDKVVN